MWKLDNPIRIEDKCVKPFSTDSIYYINEEFRNVWKYTTCRTLFETLYNLDQSFANIPQSHYYLNSYKNKYNLLLKDELRIKVPLEYVLFMQERIEQFGSLFKYIYSLMATALELDNYAVFVKAIRMECRHKIRNPLDRKIIFRERLSPKDAEKAKNNSYKVREAYKEAKDRTLSTL